MKDNLITVAELLQRHQAQGAVEKQSPKTYSIDRPRITDNDEGEIEVTLGDRRLRRWSYGADTARRAKMLAAREYVEGYCNGWTGRMELLKRAPKAHWEEAMHVDRPYITDNDAGEITAILGRRRLRRWSYAADTDRRKKMRAAREFVEGWCACRNDMLMNP